MTPGNQQLEEAILSIIFFIFKLLGIVMLKWMSKLEGVPKPVSRQLTVRNSWKLQPEKIGKFPFPFLTVQLQKVIAVLERFQREAGISRIKMITSNSTWSRSKIPVTLDEKVGMVHLWENMLRMSWKPLGKLHKVPMSRLQLGGLKNGQMLAGWICSLKITRVYLNSTELWGAFPSQHLQECVTRTNSWAWKKKKWVWGRGRRHCSNS